MTIKQWWNGLEARERRTLGLGALVLGVILYVFVIWLPAHERADALEQRLAERRELLAWVRQATAEASALSGGGGGRAANTGGQALYSLADQSARQAGLGSALRRVEPSGDDVVVRFEGASFDALIGWLARLQQRYGVQATVVTVRSTDAAGRVNVEVTLTGGQS